MPDASQLIREDHVRVKDLFKAFEREEDTATKRAIAEEAIAELSIHSVLEETIFYPALRNRPGGEELADEAEEEHHVVDLLADEILNLPALNLRFVAKFTALANAVRHHIDEEEIVMLPKAAEMGIVELQRLGEWMIQRKNQLIRQSSTTKVLQIDPEIAGSSTGGKQQTRTSARRSSDKASPGRRKLQQRRRSKGSARTAAPAARRKAA